jgi:hypothetical protein
LITHPGCADNPNRRSLRPYGRPKPLSLPEYEADPMRVSTAIVLRSGQLPMPSQQSLRGNDGGNLR